MSSTKAPRRNSVTPSWSQKYNKTIYRVKVEGFSNALLFDRDELAALRNHIDLALGGTYVNNQP